MSVVLQLTKRCVDKTLLLVFLQPILMHSIHDLLTYLGQAINIVPAEVGVFHLENFTTAYFQKCVK